ncbi:MAG: nucleotidyltransferase domain-containing protein [Candidatus Diapherotrites archaeon]
MIQKIMDSKSKISLLAQLLDRPGSFSVSELGRLAGLPKATVSLIVKDWLNTGIVLAEVQGRNKMVRLNQKFYVLPEIRKFFSKTTDFQAPLLKRLKSSKAFRSPKVKAMVVFGSRAGKNFAHASDLDVLIVPESKKDKAIEGFVVDFVKATAESGVRFSPVFIEKAELKARLQEHDNFAENILGNGVILKGGKWLERL